MRFHPIPHGPPDKVGIALTAAIEAIALWIDVALQNDTGTLTDVEMLSECKQWVDYWKKPGAVHSTTTSRFIVQCLCHRIGESVGSCGALAQSLH
jgi:hypothetical protein